MRPVKQQYGCGLYRVAGGYVWCDDARTGERVGPVYATVFDAMFAIWTGKVQNFEPAARAEDAEYDRILAESEALERECMQFLSGERAAG